MKAILASKPDTMPQGVWDSLLYLLASKIDNDYDATLTEVWQSKGGHWKAKFVLNIVEVRYYYSTTRQKWKRS